MSSGLVLSLIILAMLAGMLFYMTRDEGGLQPALKGLQELNIKLPKKLQATATPTKPDNNQFTSGNSRFSQGACKSNSDCVTSGCSGEVCTSNKGVITTCEYSESFPNAQGLKCGCYQNICGWK